MTEMTQQDFLAKYGTLISQTILKNNISYTTEKMPMYKGQRYYINTKDVYLFVLQMQDPTHIQESRYMFYAAIKADGTSVKFCGKAAQKYYKKITSRYEKLLIQPYGRVSPRLLNDGAYRQSKVR